MCAPSQREENAPTMGAPPVYVITLPKARRPTGGWGRRASLVWSRGRVRANQDQGVGGVAGGAGGSVRSASAVTSAARPDESACASFSNAWSASEIGPGLF